jgi:hypothetical protein
MDARQPSSSSSKNLNRQLKRPDVQRFPDDTRRATLTKPAGMRHVKSRVRTICGKNPIGWKRPFDDPIELPGGRRLVTLEDAGNYITELPKAEHNAPEWQTAMRALMLVAPGGPTMFAWIVVSACSLNAVDRSTAGHEASLA